MKNFILEEISVVNIPQQPFDDNFYKEYERSHNKINRRFLKYNIDEKFHLPANVRTDHDMQDLAYYMGYVDECVKADLEKRKLKRILKSGDSKKRCRL